MANTQDVLRTTRTYATRKNAVEALGRAADKVGIYDYRYMIAVKEDGRYAPVVFMDGSGEKIMFAHNGVTVV